MIIQPKVRGFICINAHPQGCAANVQEQIDYITAQPALKEICGKPSPKNVLVIGSSTGFGLASRIMAAFGCGANTLGIFFEKPPTEKKTASAGYYNAAALDKAAQEAGLYSKSLNDNAFSNACRDRVVETIQKDFIEGGLGKIDLVIYSLAAPRREDPNTGELYTSVLKPLDKAVTQKNLNTDKLEISDMTIEPATEEEIRGTVKVMGGEDWELWAEALVNGGVLNDDCVVTAYSYIGDKLTWPIYGKAAIGKAKQDLDRAAKAIGEKLQTVNGTCRVSVLKAVVTQSSSAIPIMPLYISILFKVMKENGTHEGCIQQLYRLYTECLFNDSPRLDDDGRFRVDNKELDPAVQSAVEEIWPQVTAENLNDLTDYSGYHAEFLRLFGFGVDGVDYQADTSPLVEADF